MLKKSNHQLLSIKPCTYQCVDMWDKVKKETQKPVFSLMSFLWRICYLHCRWNWKKKSASGIILFVWWHNANYGSFGSLQFPSLDFILTPLPSSKMSWVSQQRSVWENMPVCVSLPWNRMRHAAAGPAQPREHGNDKGRKCNSPRACSIMAGFCLHFSRLIIYSGIHYFNFFNHIHTYIHNKERPTLWINLSGSYFPAGACDCYRTQTNI